VASSRASCRNCLNVFVVCSAPSSVFSGSCGIGMSLMWSPACIIMNFWCLMFLRSFFGIVILPLSSSSTCSIFTHLLVCCGWI